jgi:SAM-dependent methyltransferase
MSYAQKVQEQIKQFQGGIDPFPLTESFHYWSNEFVRPRVLAEFGTETITDLYAVPFADYCKRKTTATFVSLGSGDASNEIEIAKALLSRGHKNFKFHCLDLIPEMVGRSNHSIVAANLSDYLDASIFDVNRDGVDQHVDAWMAHQSLHHFLELEKVFNLIVKRMTDDGCFLTMDMIGRNGHKRWPEVLQYVEAIWKILPPEKRYNHQHRQEWQQFVNYDCSQEGFEGIRAQDILPLLNERFRFTHFVGVGGVIDPFLDRGFCRNYDPQLLSDRLFIDTVEVMNSVLLKTGVIKPTIMFARMSHQDGSPQHPAVLKSIRVPDPALLDGAPRALNVVAPERRLCPVCGPSDVKSVATLKNTFGKALSRSSFELLQCTTCNMIYQSPLPTNDDFKSMYEDAVQFTSAEYRDPIKVESALAYYKHCAQQMLEMMNFPPAPHVLEIGAGLAWICRAIKRIDPSAVAIAQDVSSECATECSWTDQYIIGTVDDIRLGQHGPYDIISMTHVIEHLPYPITILKRLRTLLRANGCILVTCPHRPEDWDKDPSVARWSAWSYNHVPGHLQYFSRDGMANAAKAADLRLVHWTLHENGQAIEAILRPAE